MNFIVFGAGDGVLFTNGKCVDLKWARDLPFDESLNYTDDIYAQTRYLYADNEDEEVILNKGKTWICLVWNKYKDYTSYS